MRYLEKKEKKKYFLPDDADIPDDKNVAFERNTMRLTRLNAVAQAPYSQNTWNIILFKQI